MHETTSPPGKGDKRSSGRKPWIVLVTHGMLGYELKRSVEMIIGRADNIHCLSLAEGEDPSELRSELSFLLAAAPAETIIFTDLFGGTPSNVAAMFTRHASFTFISGVNLPMVIEAAIGHIEDHSDAGSRSESLIQIGGDGIKDIGREMSERGSVRC